MGNPWRAAFLLQARSDFDMAKELRKAGAPDCHWLHFLQMATEKLSKGVSCSPTKMDAPPRSHRGFSVFIRKEARRAEGLRRFLKLELDQFRRNLETLEPIVHEIERLAPAIAGDGPNAEYPWAAPGMVQAPVSYRFPEITVWNGPHLDRLYRLLEGCFRVFH